jgi:hypothetical protein
MPLMGYAVDDAHRFYRVEPIDALSFDAEPAPVDGLEQSREALKQAGYAGEKSYGFRFTGTFDQCADTLRDLVNQQVQHYRNDLSVDLDAMAELMQCRDIQQIAYPIGLRTCGVDSLSFLHHRDASYYTSCYMVWLHPADGTVTIEEYVKVA